MGLRNVSMSGRATAAERRRCRACREDFGSVEAFARHRQGPMADRHCSTPSALLEAGLVRDSRGCWQKPKGATAKLAGSGTVKVAHAVEPFKATT